MKYVIRSLAAASLVAFAFAAPVAQADTMIKTDTYMKNADRNKDGMVSKAEAMMMCEMAFDKADKDKKGMMDKKMVDTFLKMLSEMSFGG